MVYSQLRISYFRNFRSSNGTKPGKYKDLWIREGNNNTFVGELPEHYRSLEMECVWGDELLEERIVTGKNMYELVI